MKRSMILVIILLVGVLNATTLWDNNLKVRSSLTPEWTKAASGTPDGGMLYVWTDTRDNDRDLFVQRVSPLGNPVWAAPRIIDNKTGIQKNPILTATSDGNYVVAWIDYYNNRYGDIRVQKIDISGQVLWQQGGISVTDSLSTKLNPMLVADAVGGVIITWTLNNAYGVYQYAQSFGATGNRRWQQSGIVLIDLEYYLVTSLQSDGGNGFIIAYSSDYDSGSRVYINRFNADGNPAWIEPVGIGDGTTTNRMGILAKSADALYLLWYCYDGYDSFNYVHKYSLQGIPLWTDALQIVTGAEGYDIPQELVYSVSDDSVILTNVHCGTDGELLLRKISSNGEILWDDSELVGTSPEYLFGFTTYTLADGQGGCYIAWTQFPGDAYNNADIYAKHYNAAGQNVWQTGGVPLMVLPERQTVPHLSVSGDRIWASWGDRRNGMSGIAYQMLTPNGVPQLEPNGRVLLSGMNSMFTEGRMTVARSNDMVLLWDDDRADESRSQIYMQGINPNGSFDFAPNGISVTQYTDGPQYIYSAEVLPNDQIVVVWLDGREGQYELFAQLVGLNGDRLWGETGIRLSEHDTGWISNPIISTDNGNIYIGWISYENYGNGSIGTVWMQKITAGQPQWGTYGLNIINETEQHDNRLFDLQGRYMVYTKRPLNGASMTDIFALKFTETDGSPSIGWGTVGQHVSQGSPLTVYNRNCVALKTFPDRAVIIYTEYSSELGETVMAQTFDADGHYLFPPAGTLIIDPLNGFASLSADCQQEDFDLLWNETDEFNTYTMMQRYSYSVAPLWESLLIGTNIGYSPYTNLIRFANNASGIVWRDPYDDPNDYSLETILYLYVTPEGDITTAEPYSITTNQCSVYSLQSAVISNHALLTWSDGPTYWSWKDEPIEHCNLWAQMIGNATVAIDDTEEVPGIRAVLYPNYPNPFNPSTTISYQISEAVAVELAIYNLKGQLIRTLVREAKSVGTYAEIWDGKDNSGRSVGSGVYLYRLSAGADTQSHKMVLMK